MAGGRHGLNIKVLLPEYCNLETRLLYCSIDISALRTAMDELKLARAFVVNQSESAYAPFPGVRVVPASELLGSQRWKL